MLRDIVQDMLVGTCPQSPVLEELWWNVHPAIQDHTKGSPTIPPAFDPRQCVLPGDLWGYVYPHQYMWENKNKRNKTLML